MPKLQPLPGSELTAYVVELLAKYRITTVQHFLAADVNVISKKANLSVLCVEQLQNKLREIHKPKRLNLLQYYKRLKETPRNFNGFGIDTLDELLGSKNLNQSSFFEIFGIGAIGKTRFCHTVALNFMCGSKKAEVLYIDTKHDFSGSVLYQIMCSRNVDKTQRGEIMQSVKVERTYTLHGVYKILEVFEESLENGAEIVTNIKMIIIDAIPAVWFTLNGELERSEGKYLLCKIANLLHKLATNHFIVILVVNLAVQQDEKELHVENADNSNIVQARQLLPATSISNKLSLKPALGRYWAGVPHTRLFMKMAAGADDECTNERLIEITRNSYGPIGGICRVYINDAGVVS